MNICTCNVKHIFKNSKMHLEHKQILSSTSQNGLINHHTNIVKMLSMLLWEVIKSSSCLFKGMIMPSTR